MLILNKLNKFANENGHLHSNFAALQLEVTCFPIRPPLVTSPPSPLKAHRLTRAAFLHCRAQQMVKLQFALRNRNLESLQANTNTLLVLQQRSLGRWNKKGTRNLWPLAQQQTTDSCSPKKILVPPKIVFSRVPPSYCESLCDLSGRFREKWVHNCQLRCPPEAQGLSARQRRAASSPRLLMLHKRNTGGQKKHESTPSIQALFDWLSKNFFLRSTDYPNSSMPLALQKNIFQEEMSIKLLLQPLIVALQLFEDLEWIRSALCCARWGVMH